MFNIVAITTDSASTKNPVFNRTAWSNNAPKGSESLIENGIKKLVDGRRAAKKPKAGDSLNVTVYSGHGDVTLTGDKVTFSESDAKVVDKVTGFSRDDFNDMKFAADRFWDKMAILAEAGALK